MTERTLSPRNVVAGALLIGGVLVIAMPGYFLSIVQIVIVTVAVATGLHALAANVPTGGWMFAFKWMSAFEQPSVPTADEYSGEMDTIRSQLSGWRQPVANGLAMPPEALHLLKPLITDALDMKRGDEPSAVSELAQLSLLTRAVLASEVDRQLRWRHMLPPKPREVAEVVQQVLGDLKQLTDARKTTAPFDTPKA